MECKKFNKLLSELKYLNLLRDEFAIIGSGTLAVRGLRDVNDLDIIVKDSLWNKLENKYPVKKVGISNGISLGEIDLLQDAKPWFDDVDELIDSADIIEGIRYVNLKSILKLKRMRGKEKDVRDIKLIEEYLSKKSL